MLRCPRVILCEPLDSEAAAWLRKRCDVVEPNHFVEHPAEALSEAEGIVVRTYTEIDEQLLNGAPRLRVVGRAGVGYDNIDVAACRKRGIEVVYQPDANTQAVVEFVTVVVTSRLRPVPCIDRSTSLESWQAARAQAAVVRQMNECALGVLGFGRIGRRVAAVARAIGFDVQYSDLIEIAASKRDGAVPVSAERLFETSDVITVHIDGRASNRGFISRSLLDRMKPDVLFVNTSRGFVVDAPALARFLTRHPDACAHLDVHDPEPFDDAYPLLNLANAHLSPHIAGRSSTALREMSWVVRDVVAVLEGRVPSSPVPETCAE